MQIQVDDDGAVIITIAPGELPLDVMVRALMQGKASTPVEPDVADDEPPTEPATPAAARREAIMAALGSDRLLARDVAKRVGTANKVQVNDDLRALRKAGRVDSAGRTFNTVWFAT